MEAYAITRRIAQREADEDAEVIINGIETRQRTIRRLRSFAQKADEIEQKNGSEKMLSSSIGITGGLMTVGSGIATICTAGAAAPLVAGALAVGGTATSIGGGVMSIFSTVDYAKVEKELKKNIQELLREDNEAVEVLQDVLAKIATGEAIHRERVERILLAREVQLFMLGYNCASTLLGSTTAWNVLTFALTSLGCYTTTSSKAFLALAAQVIPKVTAHIAAEGIEEVVDDIAKEAVTKISKGATKEFAQKAAATAANEAYKEALKLASKEVAEEAAEQAAREAAKKAAIIAADKAAKEAMKTAAKVTGGITAGLGGASVLWDGYNLYRGYEKYNASSELGIELNKIADFFENYLNQFIPT